MLRTLALWLGVLALLCGTLAALSARFPLALWLLVNGAILTLGIVFERWRYKPAVGAHEARGKPTGERFVDPKSGALTEVYYDAATGERSYVRVKDGKPPASS
ncbi:MAG: hypothetical protein ACHQAZ_02200 [Gammaproteobacteria bacterium]